MSSPVRIHAELRFPLGAACVLAPVFAWLIGREAGTCKAGLLASQWTLASLLSLALLYRGPVSHLWVEWLSRGRADARFALRASYSSLLLTLGVWGFSASIPHAPALPVVIAVGVLLGITLEILASLATRLFGSARDSASYLAIAGTLVLFTVATCKSWLVSHGIEGPVSVLRPVAQWLCGAS